MNRQQKTVPKVQRNWIQRASVARPGWQVQEEQTAQIIPGGCLVPGSGSSTRHNRRGDVTGTLWHVENKTTAGESISLRRNWATKIRVDADAVNKRPILAFGFDDVGSGLREDWMAFTLADAEILMAIVEAVRNQRNATGLAEMLLR